MSTPQQVVPGEFRTQVRVRSDVWYTNRLVEVRAFGEPGPRGGAPKAVQVLMTPAQALDLAKAIIDAAEDKE